MSFGPVISGATLSKDKVVGAEELSVRTGTDGIHGTGLQIGENGARDVTSLHTFMEVDVDALQLTGIVSCVRTVALNAVFGRHDLPKESQG